jgi:hypothetical protein
LSNTVAYRKKWLGDSQKGWKQMRKFMVAIGVALAVFLLVDTVTAQRGTGERKGIARQAVQPAVQTIVGTLKEIKTGPCEEATGASPIGTHLILQADKETYNLHLGPASEVKDVVGIVRVGEKVETTVFRTARLPKDHYVAVTVKSGDKEIVLRDDSLRPRWAGGGGRRDRQPASRGGGAGVGRGPRLANSRVLAQSSQLDLSEEQVEKIEAILIESEKQIRKVLTDEQINMLDSRPRGDGRGGRRGPR